MFSQDVVNIDSGYKKRSGRQIGTEGRQTGEDDTVALSRFCKRGVGDVLFRGRPAPAYPAAERESGAL